MPGLPKWAEKFFSLKCTDGEAIATRPDEDVNGWDYLVEFPAREYHGPAEGRPAKEVAYAQVKSVQDKDLKATIKLSNMQIACASKQPWFIILVARGGSGARPRVYGLHVWSDLMRRSLLSVRKASVEDAQLHKRTLTISFPPTSVISGNVIAWMRSEIDSVQGDYWAAKTNLFETLGHEDGYGTVTVSVKARTEEEIAHAFLGLGGGMATTSLTHFPSRFGIPARNPISLGPGRFVFEPQPSGSCELRLRGVTGQPSLVLEGSEYAYAFPIIAPERRRIRVSAPPVDVVFVGDGRINWSLSLVPEKKYSLDELEVFGKISKWADAGPIEVTVRRKEEMDKTFTVNFGSGKEAEDRSLMADIVEAIRMVASNASMVRIQLSAKDIREAIKDLGYFYQVLLRGSMRLVLEEPDQAPKRVTSFLYYVGVTIAEWSFFCTIKRRVQSDLNVDGARQITAMAPSVLDAYVERDAGDELSARVRHDFHKTVTALEGSESPLAFGDLIDFVKSDRPVHPR